MNKIVAVALLSAFAAMPTFADDTAAKPSTGKSSVAKPSGPMPGHKMASTKDKCDAEQGMHSHHGYKMMGMMGEPDTNMMMEPDMHLLGALALNKEQQSKINQLSDELKHNNWATQGLINDETAKLRDLYEADKRDPVAIGKEYQKVFDLKRQLIETYLDTQNRIEDVLTPEQRAKMKEARAEMRRMVGHSSMH